MVIILRQNTKALNKDLVSLVLNKQLLLIRILMHSPVNKLKTYELSIKDVNAENTIVSC